MRLRRTTNHENEPLPRSYSKILVFNTAKPIFIADLMRLQSGTRQAVQLPKKADSRYQRGFTKEVGFTRGESSGPWTASLTAMKSLITGCVFEESMPMPINVCWRRLGVLVFGANHKWLADSGLTVKRFPVLVPLLRNRQCEGLCSASSMFIRGYENSV